MSIKRRASGAPVSLFAFQDVMSAIMGIMILITLLLALDLTMPTGARVQATPPEGPGTSFEDAELHPLDMLRDRLAELQRENQAWAERIGRLSEAMGLDPTELNRRLSELRKVQEEAMELERQITEIRSTPATAEEIEVQIMMDAIVEAERRVRRLRAEAEELQRNPRLTYLVQEGTNRRPILLEIGENRLGIGDPQDVGSTIFIEQPPGPARLAALEALLGLHRPTEAYFVLFLRPSGHGEYDRIRELVGSKGFNVGIELVGETTRVLE